MITGMLTGVGFTSAYIAYFKFMGGQREDWLLGISPEGIGSVGMIVNFVVGIAVALVTAPPSQETQDLVESIRVPKGAGEAHEMQVPPAHAD
jgi:cation/acetate symporter